MWHSGSTSRLLFSISSDLAITNVSRNNKCQTEQFLRINNHDIPCVSQVSDLGVTVDMRLKFSTHVSNVCVKAHRKANLILRCFESRNISSLTAAFKTYVCPVLEYCSVVWNPFPIKDIDQLEKVQRRFTKCLPALNIILTSSDSTDLT